MSHYTELLDLGRQYDALADHYEAAGEAGSPTAAIRRELKAIEDRIADVQREKAIEDAAQAGHEVDAEFLATGAGA